MLASAVRDTVAPLDGAVLRVRATAALTVDVTDDLQRLTQPVLCLRALRDRLVPERCAEAIRDAKPSAQISAVDAPHLLLQARPEESWQLIAPFLAQAFLHAAG